MKKIELGSGSFEYFKKNDFPGLDNRNSTEDVALPQSQATAERKPSKDDPGNQEREQQLETWMSDIKAFIRNIDISKL